MNRKLFFVIHGYAGGKYQIQPWLDYLATIEGYDVIVPHLTGHGEKYEDLDLTHASRSKWMIDVLDKFYEVCDNYDEIILCGHSMGGLLAVNLYRMVRAYKVTKLILLAPAFYISDFVSSKSLAKLLDEGSFNKNADRDTQLRRIKKLTIKSFYELATLSVDTRDYLADVKVPVFIGQGNRDGLVKAESPYKVYDALPANPKNVLKIYEGATHSIAYYEKNDILFNDIKEFVEQN